MQIEKNHLILYRIYLRHNENETVKSLRLGGFRWNFKKGCWYILSTKDKESGMDEWLEKISPNNTKNINVLNSRKKDPSHYCSSFSIQKIIVEAEKLEMEIDRFQRKRKLMITKAEMNDDQYPEEIKKIDDEINVMQKKIESLRKEMAKTPNEFYDYMSIKKENEFRDIEIKEVRKKKGKFFSKGDDWKK